MGERDFLTHPEYGRACDETGHRVGESATCPSNKLCIRPPPWASMQWKLTPGMRFLPASCHGRAYGSCGKCWMICICGLRR